MIADGVAADLPGEQAGRLAAARSKSVFIATPMARHPTRQYTLALLDSVLLLERLGIRCQLQWVVGNSNLPRARNELVAEFLAGVCTDLVFIDDDMGWAGKDLVRLLASSQPFIGGVGRKRAPDAPDGAFDTWCCRFDRSGAPRQDEMGAIEVLGVGTGFVKIARGVFEAVAEARPDLKRPGLASMTSAVRDRFYSFFRFVDDGPAMMSEDFAFCSEWRALGGRVFADPTIALVHVGEQEFTGTIASLLVEAQGAPG